MLGNVQALLEDGHHGVAIVAQQRGRVEPEPGKHRAAEDAIIRRSEPFVLSLTKDEPVDLAIQYAPDQVLADSVSLISSELVVQVVAGAARGDFGDELG